MILYRFWKTNKLYLWTSVIWKCFLLISAVGSNKLLYPPLKNLRHQVCLWLHNQRSMPETGGRFMVAWKLPKHVAWLSNDVNIYCHCHRPREITQTQPGYCSCSLYRVTCSPLPLALNLRYCIRAVVNEVNFSSSPNTVGRGREPVADVPGFLFLAPQIPAGFEPHGSEANSVVPQLP